MASLPATPPAPPVPPSQRPAYQAFQQYMGTLEQRCLRARERNPAFEEITAKIQEECAFGRMLLRMLRRCEQASATIQAETDRLHLRAMELLRIEILMNSFASRPRVADERQQRLRDICQSILRARGADHDWLFRIQTRRLTMLNQYLRSVLEALDHDLPNSAERLFEYRQAFEQIEARLGSASGGAERAV